MVTEHPNLVEIAKESSSPLVLLPTFHPSDDKILFFKFHNYSVMCNLQTMLLNIVIQLQNREPLGPVWMEGEGGGVEVSRVELVKNMLILFRPNLLYSTLLSLPPPQSKQTIS